ncbi:MAG: hypothetical protein IPK07_15100 [Deltaproteobacteria bacterium]|nr:hypothetical protein [Deltaproteobacteria bacterium]
MSGRLALVDRATGAIDRSFGAPPDPVVDVASAGDGRTIWIKSTQGGLFQTDLVDERWSAIPVDIHGSGFFVNASGTQLYTATDGIDRIDLTTGLRERLDTCQDVPSVLIDPDGQRVYASGILGGTPNTGYYPYLHSCDLITEERASSDVFPSSDAGMTSLGCAGTRVLRGMRLRPYSSAPPAPGSTARIFTSYDAVSLESRGDVSLLEPFDPTSPSGPVESSADCSRFWWPVTNGVFESRADGTGLRAVTEGLGQVTAIAPGDRAGTAFTFAWLGRGGALYRTDLGSGDLDLVRRDLAVSEEGVDSIAPLADRHQLAIASVDSDYVPFEETTYRSRVSVLDLTTGTSIRGAVLGDAAFGDIASCGSPARLFALGWKQRDGSGLDLVEVTESGFDVAGSREIPEPTTGSPPPGWIYGLPERGFAMSRDCDSAYFLRSGLRRFDRRSGHTTALPFWGSTFATDPRQDVLYIYNQPAGSQVRAIDLRTLDSRVIAVAVPFVDTLSVTSDGKLVLGGKHSVAVGVIDLTTGMSKRLWEGPGPAFEPG